MESHIKVSSEYMDDRYRTGRFIFPIIGILAIAMGAFLIWLSHSPGTIVGNRMTFELECFAFIGFGIFAIYKAVQTAKEFTLYKQTIGQEVIFDESGLRISIGLVGGLMRSSLRSTRKAYLHVNFNDVVSWRIPRPVGVRSLTRSYEVTLRSQPRTTILIARKPLKDMKTETNFVEALRTKLPITIDQNDVLDY